MANIPRGANILNVSLRRITSLDGTVTDEQTGAPLAGVQVTLAGGSGTFTDFTDSLGQFGFTNLTPGTYSVTFELAGYETLVV